MEHYLISRDNRYHEAWPSLCMTVDGVLVCAYAEADVHGGGAVPSAVIRRSTDQGVTWSEPIVVDILMDGPKCGFMMCRAVVCLPNGHLLLAADWFNREKSPPPGAPHNWSTDPENGPQAEVWLYRSRDGGLSWTGPERTGCLGWSLTLGVLSDGRVYIAGARYHTRCDYESQTVFFSADHGKTWTQEITVLDDPALAVSEGDIVELDDGLLVMYMRVERGGAPAGLKAISRDGGKSWEGPYRAGRWPLIGRVAAGRLSTGEVLVCHRMGGFALQHFFGYFVETAEQALAEDAGPPGVWGVLDNDTSPHADWGYGDWLELPGGDVYVVNYIVDDAPRNRPGIRGYRVSREELFSDTRSEDLVFVPPGYRRGRLEGQDGWVRQQPDRWYTRGLAPGKIGALGNYVVVEPGGALPEGHTITGTRNIGGGEEVLRRDIGPFDLSREGLRVSLTHTGRQHWCMFRVLDAGGRTMVELRSDYLYEELWARDTDGGEYLSGVRCDCGWWRTVIDMDRTSIRLSTASGQEEANEPWARLPVQTGAAYAVHDLVNVDLRAAGSLGAVVSGLVVVLGGRGGFYIREIQIRVVNNRSDI